MPGLWLRGDVTLAKLEQKHAEKMYEWMEDPLIRMNVGVRREPSLERTREWIRFAEQDELTRAYAIEFNGAHVGNVVLDRVDEYIGSARMSVYIGEVTARGKGIGLTAIYLLLEKAFDEVMLHKVWLTVHARNFAAIETYTRLGFVLEGILRQEFLWEGERLPYLYLGLLKSEFARLAVNR